MRMLGAAGHGTAFERGSEREAATRMVHGKTRFYRTCSEAIRRLPQDLHIAEPYTRNSEFRCADQADQIDILLVLLKMGVLLADKRNHVLQTLLHFAAL